MRRRSRSASQTTPFSALNFLKSAATNVLNHAHHHQHREGGSEGSGSAGARPANEAPSRLESPSLARRKRNSTLPSLHEGDQGDERPSSSSSSSLNTGSVRRGGGGGGGGDNDEPGFVVRNLDERPHSLDEDSDPNDNWDDDDSGENTGPCEFCGVDVAYVPQPAPTPVMCWNCSKITVFPALAAPRQNQAADSVLASSASLASSVLNRANRRSERQQQADGNRLQAAKNAWQNSTVRLSSSEKLTRRRPAIGDDDDRTSNSSSKRLTSSNGGGGAPVETARDSTEPKAPEKSTGSRIRRKMASLRAKAVAAGAASPSLGQLRRGLGTGADESDIESARSAAGSSPAGSPALSPIRAPTAEGGTTPVSALVTDAGDDLATTALPAGTAGDSAGTSSLSAEERPARAKSPAEQMAAALLPITSGDADATATKNDAGTVDLGSSSAPSDDAPAAPEAVASNVPAAEKLNPMDKLKKAGVVGFSRAKAGATSASSAMKAGATSASSAMKAGATSASSAVKAGASSASSVVKAGATSVVKAGHQLTKSGSNQDSLRIPLQTDGAGAAGDSAKSKKSRTPSPRSRASSRPGTPDLSEQTPVTPLGRERRLSTSSQNAAAAAKAAGSAAGEAAGRMFRRAGSSMVGAVKAGKSRLESSIRGGDGDEGTIAEDDEGERDGPAADGSVVAEKNDWREALTPRGSDDGSESSTTVAAQDFQERRERIKMLKQRVSVRHATKTPPPSRRAGGTPQSMALMRRRQSMRMSPRGSGDSATPSSPSRSQSSGHSVAGGRFERRRNNLNAYSPDNLAYLKAQTALLALQASKVKEDGNEDGDKAKPAARTAAPVVTVDGPAAPPALANKLHSPADRYKRLMERRQSRRVGGNPLPVFHAKSRAQLATAVEADEEEKPKGTADANTASAQDVSGPSEAAEAAPAVAGAVPGAGATRDRFARRRGTGGGTSGYLDAQKALLAIAERKKAMAAVEEAARPAATAAATAADDDLDADSLLESLENTPLDSLASSASGADQLEPPPARGRPRAPSRGASGALAAAAAAMMAERQEQAAGAGGADGAAGGSQPKGMSGFVRAPPARFQKLLQKRQEQFSAAMQEGGEGGEGGAATGNAATGGGKQQSISTEVSVEQYAMVKSLEDFYKGLGQQPAEGSGPASFAGMRRMSERLDDADEDGDTPMHQAAYDGQLEIVAYLQSKGADVNRRNAFDETPLYVASMNGQLPVVQYLAEHGADIDALSVHGNTALDVAATDDVRSWLVAFVRRRRGRRHSHDPSSGLPPEVAALRDTLEDGGDDGEGGGAAADGSPVRGEGGGDKVSPGASAAGAQSPEALARAAAEAAAKLAMSEDLLDAAQQGDVGEIERLLRQGALATFVDESDGWTALHHAAFEGHDRAAECLLRAGAVVDAPDFEGYTPLHWAVCQDATAIARLLLEGGAAVDGLAGDAQSAPLHLAARADDATDLCRLLLERGADVSAVDGDGETALHHAADAGDADACKLLVSRGAEVRARGKDGATPLHYACAASHLAVARVLLERGALADDRDDDMETPLHWICKCRELLTPTVTMALMQLLYNHAAESAAASESTKKKKPQPQTAAADTDGKSAATALVNATDVNGDRPLHAAAREGHGALVTWLCEHGAVVDAQNDSGWTALHWAASEGRLPIVQGLVERWQADADPRDKHGESPLQMAAFEDHLAVARFLVEKAGADLRPVMPWAETAADSRVAQWLETQRRDWEAEQRRKGVERRKAAADKKAAADEALARATAEAFAAGDDDDDDELLEGLDPGELVAAARAVSGSGGGVAATNASIRRLLRGASKGAQQLAAVKEEEADDARRRRDMYLALAACSSVLVAIVWKKVSVLLAVLLAVVLFGAIWFKKVYDSL